MKTDTKRIKCDQTGYDIYENRFLMDRYSYLVCKNHKVKHAHALASDSSVTRKLLGKPLYPLFSQIETYYINKGLVGADVIIAQNVFQQQMLSKRYGKESILVNQMTPSVDESCLQKNTIR